LDFIKAEFEQDATKPQTVLFLDINMPVLTGWDFLAAFEKFSATVKERIKIYMLSSSVDQRDKDRAASNQYVKDYIVKPLSKDRLMQLAQEEEK
jgi:two-component system chemotaxis response regulator CheY